MTEYLVKRDDIWHIGRPGVIEDDTEECTDARCDGGIINPPKSPNFECPTCKGKGRIHSGGERTLRLAWFERDGAFICFDYEQPEVRRLPDV